MFNTNTADFIDTAATPDSESDTFTVFMSRELVDKLDYPLSPADGIVAIDQVFRGLPKVHTPAREHRWRFGSHVTFRVYRANISWAMTGISYIQVSMGLHVIDVWEYPISSRQRFDAVLPPMEYPDEP